MKLLKYFLFALLIGGVFCSMSCNSDYPDETETASTDEDAVSDSLTETADADNEAELRRIFIKDGSFHVGGSEAKPIWINGTNTPWDKWNDFGGGYNDEWWDAHFAALHENGVNAVRVWINCNNGQNAVIIDENGMVSGISDKHREDLDAFFDTARRNQIYIMATLLSFDHFKGNTADRWRNMVQSKEAVDSFVTNYTLPFVNRYKDNPYLWSIDLMNEPDWVHENAECGQLAWEDLSYFFAVNTAAIRENSPILVTVGMAFPKYNADGNGYEGNKVSDEFMQVLYDNPNASLDFWSPHYYDWVGRWYGVPFTSSSYGLRSEGGWGLCDSKPAIIAETSAMGSAGYTLTEDYINAFDNGWQGVMAWTSNGVDDNGGFEELTPATRYIAEMYAELVFPLG